MKNSCLITGGAGFVGLNLANYYLAAGHRVHLLDNLSRPGSIENIRWLSQQYGEKVRFVKHDIRSITAEIRDILENVDVVFHFAAQVAVTSSIQNPREDFEVNALGTLNLLEAIRLSSTKPALIYASTNKVYGPLRDVEILECDSRYSFVNSNGISESHPLNFQTPYACSKGIADLYVSEYARTYGLKTIVFRQSCIYGPHQFGVEDQGWLAWIVARTICDLPVTIYGNGKQVRDVLYIDDLISAYDLAIKNIEQASGQAYNIGGGPENTISLLELLDWIAAYQNKTIRYEMSDWRPQDQLVYISDIRKAESDFRWRPRVTLLEGLPRLANWLEENRQFFTSGT